MAADPMDNEAIETARPSRKPLLLAALAALALGAGGGFAAATLLGADAEAAPAEAPPPAGEELAPAADGAVDGATPERAVVSLGRFTVNLRGGSGGRILRAQVEIEVSSTDAARVEGASAMLRDGVILLASDYTYADLDGLDGKLRLRDELLARLNALLGAPVVRRVYFTEFVVQ
jgi:flagellar FliL protein